MPSHGHLLEAWGLGLLLTSVLLGLLSLWLDSRLGRSVAQRFPGVCRLLQTRSLMLLLLASGVCLLLLSLFRAPVSQQPATPPAGNSLPGEPARTTPATVPITTMPVPESAPVVVDAPNPQPAATATRHAASPLRVPKPTKPEPNLPAITARPVPPPKATPAQAAAPNGQEVPVKKNIFSSRCARLVEKVGAGEPMTPQEQNEMVSKCQ